MGENQHNGIFRPDRDNITDYRKVLKAARDGEMIKLRNGLYARPEAIADNVIDIEAIVPDGILCLYSAWAHYGLSTQVPDAFYVAVERSRKLSLPSFPNIKLVFQSRQLLDIGRTYTEERGFRFAITDLERSVCDAIKYRNKIGIDVMTEIINNYLRCPSRNLSRLADYAKHLRVYTTLLPILQVKL
jgi:predicted transcriptional regulator of viral defense system